MRGLAEMPDGEIPDERLLARLVEGWANGSMTARPLFLDAVARHAVQARGPILECGSGLTTIVLHRIAGRRGVPCVSLEHLAPWVARVAGALRRGKQDPATILPAPLRDYGEFSWYDVAPEDLPDGIELVVCDGPPGSTPGGRYGLLPVLGGRLAPRVTILLDDAERPGEAEVLERWTRDWPFEAEVHRGPEGRAYAVLRRVDRSWGG